MTIQTPEQTPIREFYGNEEQRLAELKALDFDTFKAELIDIHNNRVPQAETEASFITAGQNRTMGGSFFPDAKDKEDLLKYALEQAQQQDDIQVAALILGTAVVAVHPFNDGNGRTSRALYTKLSRGLDESDYDYRLAVLSRDGQVSFGDPKNLIDALMPYFVKEEAGVELFGDGTWYLSSDPEAAKFHYAEREYHGLTDSERQRLDPLLGSKFGSDGDRAGREGGNSEAVWYGLSKLQAEMGVQFPTKHFEMSNRTLIVKPDTLAMLDGDAKRKLIDYITEYPKVVAKIQIDLMGRRGDMPLKTKSGKVESMRDYVVRETSNFLTSRIGGAAHKAALEAKKQPETDASS